MSKPYQRREQYTGKRAIDGRMALIAHIGSSWEIIWGTVPDHDAFNERGRRQYVLDAAHHFYRSIPDHPFHPEARIDTSTCPNHSKYQRMSVTERKQWRADRDAAVEVWFKEHESEWKRVLESWAAEHAP